MRVRRAAAAAAALLALAALAAAQDQAPAQGPRDLVRETLATDIESAGYYELVAWCRTLGLPETGSRTELQARLYAHFGVTPPPEPEKPARVIVVESARSSDYFTIEGIDEDYLILEGDVRVEFRDAEAGVSHRVAAERLIVNQTRRTLSASGGVSYELARRTGAPEIFRGESFTFDLTGWGGLILDGRGQSERVLEEGEPAVTFYYRGESIVRRENETVILHDGSVTSSVAEDPYWQIAASRIWVLGPGEWAIRSGVLQVGRVPLFYIPFFYKPGDEILFHPSIGYRNREGSFIQTTTYLIGQAEQKPGTLSFLRLTGDEESYDTEVEGIFLHKVKREGEPREGERKEDKDVFKVMVDYYSRLGGFAGVLLVLDPVWSLKGGVGLTRTLFESAGVYSPFEAGSTVSDWNTVEMGALELPFRFGLEGGVSLSGQAGSLQASLAHFSDPYFSSDFYNRAEKINWTGLLAGPEAAAAEVEPGGLDAAERQNLSWTLTGRYKAAPAAPWVESFEVPKVDLALYWQGRDNADYAAEDPARRFFAPTRLVAPDLRLRVAGSLYKSARPGAQPGAAAPSGDQEDQPRIPAPRDADEEEAEEPEVRLPAPLPDLAGLDAAYAPASFEVGYALEPRVLFESQYNQQDWTTPGAIDLEFLYSSLEISGANRLQSLLRLWDERLEVRTGLELDGVYRARFNRADSYYDESPGRRAEWDSLLVRDYQATRMDLGPTVDVAFLPLADRRALAQTRLTYGVSWDAFSLDYVGPVSAPLPAGYSPDFVGRFFDWEADTVSRHELAGRLTYKPGLAADFLDLKADLPPRTGYYRGEADLTLGISRTNARGGYKELENEWVYDPLVITETLDPAAWVQAVGRFEIDLNDQELDSADNTLRLVRLTSASGGWLLQQRVVLATLPAPLALTLAQSTVSAFGFTARFLAERRVPVEWQGDPKNAFVAEAGERARMLPAEAALTYTAPSQPLFSWHNRIRLVPVVSSSLVFDLYRFTNSRLDLTAGLKASIYRFVDLDFSVTSYNTRLYRYIRSWAEEVGEVWVDPWDDLLRSYSFADEDERRLSAFKLRSINVKATHDLGDWSLAVEYSGSQKLQSKTGGGDEYVWTPLFSIVIEWRPIPEIRREVRRDADGLSVRGS